MLRSTVLVAAALLISLPSTPSAQRAPYRTLDDKFKPPVVGDLAQWKQRAAYLREHILASAGLLPMPERTALRAEIFDEVKRTDYTVAKVYFESLPGFFVTGNLYRPAGTGPFPAVLAPHGHWAYGRLENTSLNSVPGRAINLARQGYVVFTHDMIGYNDSRQLPHTFGGKRETLWGLSLAGLQLWNSIRALDFLQSLPDVQADSLAVTGESGGGTQTFLLAAVDDRVKVAVPVNMISLHMQGGCLCENPPLLRLDTTNVEIAATIAPRPLLMISATGDWTVNTLELEFPAVRGVYNLMDAGDRVDAVRFTAEHNYNQESREAMYAWLARWMKGAAADTRIKERSFTPEPLPNLLVFHQRQLPSHAVTAAQLTNNWIAAAERQLTSATADARGSALRHALGFDETPPSVDAAAMRRDARLVLVADASDDVERELQAAKLTVQRIAFTPFDTAAAGRVRHFETYNRTPAAERVADIVAAVRAHPGAALVASGDAALAALLAAAVAPPRRAILDVGTFDTSSDADFVARLYIPGLRRAGDLQTAARVAGDAVVIHGAGGRFAIEDRKVQHTKLTPREIARAITARPRPTPGGSARR